MIDLLKYIKLFVVALLIIGSLQAKAQQFFSYSQYMNNLTPLNSAYSLLDKNASLSALLRRQWVGVEGSPSTFIFNGNLPIESINGAAGLMVLNDQFFVEHLTEINGFFAKGIQLGQKQFLGVSLNLGIRRYVANYSSLDPNDPVFRNDVRENKPNVGFGVMIYSPDQYYFGVSVPELSIRDLGNASVQTADFFRNHYNFAGAYLFGKEDDDVRVKPAFLATYTKGVPFVADMSMSVYVKNTVGLGLNYRTNNEMAGIFSINSDLLKLGYSYQFGSSSNNVGGRLGNATHEVTLTYRFGSDLLRRSVL
ncbi:PorP/SprF family type IX secretion system membrane protein [Mucilaginibacter terrae]|uniref:Type IX secretion system PorP/SprF family membrane protein n=1 Tax=Mucilaginibacter terrae TaxID=1955052 RepID=A0ABU3GYF0_9SPHI|nr:PorP/SprF family type IX secretion system membrane protein [Mucilaginibacter terrae]MDT3403700.1 type IX secretion system PorP/SprF family membrane protein [Mucilaginibacter terrae]